MEEKKHKAERGKQRCYQSYRDRTKYKWNVSEGERIGEGRE